MHAELSCAGAKNPAAVSLAPPASLLMSMKPSTRELTVAMSLLARIGGNLMRVTMTAVVFAFSMVGLASAQNAAAAIKSDTNVPAQPLSSALAAFARDRELQVIFRSEVVGDRRTAGAVGRFTPEEELKRLLTGTGLGYLYLNERTITIVATSAGGGAEVPLPPPAGPAAGRPAVGGNQGREGKSGSSSGFRLAQVGRDARSPDVPVRRASGASPAGAEEARSLAEVTVTGSRIARSTNDLPAPATIIGAPAIAETGLTSVQDVLNRVPQFGMSVGVSDQYGIDEGATLINLRGLGTNRTLVLVDGQRRVSGTASSSAVDLSTIPANMIDRIEVITGGASAVYGADAVTGVVNVILKHHADGLELSTKGGISTYGDDNRVELGIRYGQSFADDGEFTFGLSYTHEEPLKAGARPWGQNPPWDFANPNVTAANPYINLPYPGWRFPNTSYGGAFVIGGVRYTIGADGSLRPTQNGSLPYGPLGYLGAGGGDGYNNTDFQYLRIRSDVLAALVHAAKRMDYGLTLTTDFQFSRASTDAPLEPLYDSNLVIQRNNPFVPAAVGALMDQNGLSQISVGRTDWDQGVNHRLGDRSTYTLVEKLSGALGGFNWNVFYQYGRYQNESTFTDDRITSRYLQALDVIQGPSGPECADPAAVTAGCKPLDIFGPRAATPAALAYFLYSPVTNIQNSQQVTGGQIEGPVVRLPAGPLAVSAGVEYRKESQDTQQDGLGSEGDLFYQYGPSSKASFAVKEAYAEVLAPVLKDRPFAKALELDGAVRESDYDTAGSSTTWRLGAQWAPTRDVRFRVTRSFSVRAPNLTELYSPGVGSFGTYYDPCSAVYIQQGSSHRAANCAALGVPAGYVDPLAGDQRNEYTLGNPSLGPEKSRSWTAGVVLTPARLAPLELEVDWWSIDIAAAINALPVQQIVNGCVDAASLGNSLCPLVLRGGTFEGRPVGIAITQVNLAPLNIGALEAEGVDFNLAYGLDLPARLLRSQSSLSWMLDGSYYIKNDSLVNASDPSNVIRLAGETVLPKLRANLTTQLEAGSASFDWILRYISHAVVDENDPPLFYADNKVGSIVYSDLYGSYEFRPGFTLSAGINNLMNRNPPTNDSIGVLLGELAQPYDYVGRYFFLEFKARL